MKITIAGCGNMGLIYAKAFIRFNAVSAADLLLMEKNEMRKKELESMRITTVILPDDKIVGQTDLLLLAVKPQDFTELCKDLKGKISKDCIVISIMAGVTISRIKELLDVNYIVRAMPNSPAALGKAITGFVCSDGVSEIQKEKVVNILRVTGKTVFLENESLLNAVTALSGSGPAYFFYIVKHMIDAGKQLGLTDAVAGELVKETLLGSYYLLEDAAVPIDKLISTVASRGGTTEAALTTMEAYKTGEGIITAILAACQRAKELAK